MTDAHQSLATTTPEKFQHSKMEGWFDHVGWRFVPGLLASYRKFFAHMAEAQKHYHALGKIRTLAATNRGLVHIQYGHCTMALNEALPLKYMPPLALPFIHSVLLQYLPLTVQQPPQQHSASQADIQSRGRTIRLGRVPECLRHPPQLEQPQKTLGRLPILLAPSDHHPFFAPSTKREVDETAVAPPARLDWASRLRQLGRKRRAPEQPSPRTATALLSSSSSLTHPITIDADDSPRHAPKRARQHGLHSGNHSETSAPSPLQQPPLPLPVPPPSPVLIPSSFWAEIELSDQVKGRGSFGQVVACRFRGSTLYDVCDDDIADASSPTSSISSDEISFGSHTKSQETQSNSGGVGESPKFSAKFPLVDCVCKLLPVQGYKIDRTSHILPIKTRAAAAGPAAAEIMGRPRLLKTELLEQRRTVSAPPGPSDASRHVFPPQTATAAAATAPSLFPAGQFGYPATQVAGQAHHHPPLSRHPPPQRQQQQQQQQQTRRDATPPSGSQDMESYIIEAMVTTILSEAPERRVCPQLHAVFGICDRWVYPERITLALVSEQYDGTLESLLRTDPNMSQIEPMIKILAQVADALAYLQSRFKFIHGDLTCNNLMYRWEVNPSMLNYHAPLPAGVAAAAAAAAAQSTSHLSPSTSSSSSSWQLTNDRLRIVMIDFGFSLLQVPDSAPPLVLQNNLIREMSDFVQRGVTFPNSCDLATWVVTTLGHCSVSLATQTFLSKLAIFPGAPEQMPLHEYCELQLQRELARLRAAMPATDDNNGNNSSSGSANASKASALFAQREKQMRNAIQMEKYRICFECHHPKLTPTAFLSLLRAKHTTLLAQRSPARSRDIPPADLAPGLVAAQGAGVVSSIPLSHFRQKPNHHTGTRHVVRRHRPGPMYP